MPAGPGPMGFAYFLAAKFVGYSAFCHLIVSPRVARLKGVPESPVPTSMLGAALAGLPIGKTSTQSAIPSSVKAGVIRTLIGVTIGAMVGFGFWAIPYFSSHDSVGSVLFLVFLVPVRVGEWALLYRWIYRIHPFADLGGMKLITFGILVSFVLDFVAMASAWVLPGGFWVC